MELEYQGVGDMLVLHVNYMPASNYDRLMRVIARHFGEENPQIEHAVDVRPHPTRPDSLPARHVRTATWRDGQGRVWRITSEYVAQGGVYDGYEVISPPLHDPRELEAVVAAIQSSELVEPGLRSGAHVHVNGSCLFSALSPEDGSAIANLVLLSESYEPLIRRLFHTTHLGGSANPFSQPLALKHSRLVADISMLPPEQRTLGNITAIFERHSADEMQHVRADLRPSNADKAWKYHSINLCRMLRLNPHQSQDTHTIEFRAFDVGSPYLHRMQAEFARAMVLRAAQLANEGVSAIYNGPLSLDPSQRPPDMDDTAYDLLSRDADDVRAMARDMLAYFALPVDEFSPLLEAIGNDHKHRDPASSTVDADADTTGDADAGGAYGDGLSADFVRADVEEFLGQQPATVLSTSQRLASPRRFVRYLDSMALLDRNGRGVSGSCDSNPCQHGGTCDVIDKEPVCTCATGYTGVTCETAINPCLSNPCDVNAVCDFIGPGRFNCTCEPGYTGDGFNCTEINGCDSSPCHNGGTCINLRFGNFSCICAAGYTGPVCQTTVNACGSNPCQHGGTCTDHGDGFSCTCATGYTGTVCQSQVNPCDSNPCSVDATCTPIGLTNFTCQCNAGYVGDGFSCVVQSPYAMYAQGDGSAELSYTLPSRQSIYIAFQFRTVSADCVFVYNNGSVDFVFVGMIGGNLWFSYNFGSGLVDAFSGTLLNDGQTHSVVGTIIPRASDNNLPWLTLVVDSETIIRAPRGTSRTLNSDNIFRVGSGMRGCVSNLQLDVTGPLVNFSAPGIVFRGRAGIGCPPDANACLMPPCGPYGTCTPVPPINSFSCSCFDTFQGPTCETTTTNTVQFNGNGYAALRGPVVFNKGSQQSVGFTFRTTYASGQVILFQSSTVGDYMTFFMDNIGCVLWQYDLGSGRVTLVTRRCGFNDGRAYRVQAYRSYQNGSLYVNDVLMAQGRSPGVTTSLDTEPPLWVGGGYPIDVVPLPVPPFFGCVRDLISFNTLANFFGNVTSSNMIPGCYGNDNYLATFGATPAARLTYPTFSPGGSGTVGLYFRTQAPNGTLVYQGGVSGDFFSIGIGHGGIIAFAFSTGTTPVILTTANAYNDGAWHRLVATRSINGAVAQLYVDNEVTTDTLTPSPSGAIIDTSGPLYIGNSAEGNSSPAQTCMHGVAITGYDYASVLDFRRPSSNVDVIEGCSF